MFYRKPNPLIEPRYLVRSTWIVLLAALAACSAHPAPSAQSAQSATEDVPKRPARAMKQKAASAQPAAAAQPKASPAAPAGEIRGVWITRWDYRTPEDVRAIVRNAASVGFTDLYFQVRGAGTCFFPSEVEPWAWELSGKTVATTGQDPGWDPLALAIAEAHARGVRLHAYMNAMPGWNDEEIPPSGVDQLTRTHPDWFMVDAKGRPMTRKTHKFYAFLNPAKPEVRQYLAGLFADVARRYKQLDGIHLDYLRYPDPSEANGNSFSYDPYSLAEFRAKVSQGKDPSEAPELWDRYRAVCIEMTLRDIVAAIAKENDRIEVSCAVVANYEAARTTKGQRWLEWPARVELDAFIPMAYHYDMADYGAYLDTCLGPTRPARGKVVVGIWPSEKWESKGFTPARMAEQIEAARRRGADGVALFCYERFFPNNKPNAWAQYLKTHCFK